MLSQAGYLQRAYSGAPNYFRYAILVLRQVLSAGTDLFRRKRLCSLAELLGEVWEDMRGFVLQRLGKLRATRLPDHEMEVHQDIARRHIRRPALLNHPLNCGCAQLIAGLVNHGQGHEEETSVSNVVEPTSRTSSGTRILSSEKVLNNIAAVRSFEHTMPSGWYRLVFEGLWNMRRSR